MYKDRIKDFRRVKASDLKASPHNWRKHPRYQREALKGMLEDVGFADAVIARETKDGLELIDGHLRTALDTDQLIPVLVVDVTDEEAKKLLATIDPIAALAETDSHMLEDLIATLNFGEESISDMLANLLPMGDQQNPLDEWLGMPEYQQADISADKQLTVNFAKPEDMEAFAQLIGQSITPKTRSIWFPEAEVAHTFAQGRYITDDDTATSDIHS